MNDTGFVVLRNDVDPNLCDRTREDYERFLTDNQDMASQYVDAAGHHLRFVDFHQVSANALALGNHERVLRLLDFLFGRSAGIYTSLTFEYGTQQPIHRDSPFFHTYPINYFFGVWYPLEDIHPDSGPLMYIPGGHRFEIDRFHLFDVARRTAPTASRPELVTRALQLYYGEVMREAAKIAEPEIVDVRRGDVAIWHPAVPHGGSPARNGNLTRKSMVFHCAPTDMQVFQHDAFFTAPDQPPPRYGYKKHGDRLYAVSGPPAFQK
jgi:ectoine hydroxylase-related dioxygenase (phytanoyl-CoA dioxygenase family)